MQESYYINMYGDLHLGRKYCDSLQRVVLQIKRDYNIVSGHLFLFFFAWNFTTL